MAQPGMFGSLFRPREDVSDLDYARLTPAEQRAFDTRGYQRMAEQGVSQAGRGLLGMPIAQTTDRTAVVEELRTLAKTARPGTKEFYTAAVALFTKHGMVEEATKMQEQLAALTEKERAVTLETRKADAPTTEVEKLQAARNRALAAGNTAAAEELTKRIDALVREKVGSQQADPEITKLMNARDALPEGHPNRATYDAMIAKKIAKGGDGEKPMTAYQKEQLRLKEEEVSSKKTEREARTARADQAAIRALQATARAVDSEVRAATELLSHPGLGYITGPVFGRTPSLSSAGAGAQALLDQVLAQSFIRALQDLKATSATGASGLGQLTEREGDKIQNARVALNPIQPTEQFRRTLTRYIGELKALAAAARSDLGSAAPAAASAAAPVAASAAKPAAASAAAPVAKPVSPPGTWKARELK